VSAPPPLPPLGPPLGLPGPGLVRPLQRPVLQPPPREATRAQRIGLVLGLFAAAAAMLWLFSSILLPFVAAAFIAYFLDPPTTRLARSGVPRGLAALLMIVALVATTLIAVLLLYPLLLAQLGTLIARVPAYVFSLRGWAGDVVARLQDRLGSEYVNTNLRDLVAGQAGAMLGFVAGALTRIVGSGFALFNVISLVVITPVVAFYLLRDWPRAVARVDGWLPRRYAGVLRAQGREVDRILSAWLRGQALCCLALALFYAVALQLAGLDLGLIVGISSGLLSFIPYVGTITGAIASVGLAFAQFPDWRGVAIVGGVFVLGQILEGYVIYPRFLGDRVELHAVWVIFALFAGAAVFGFLGVLLAVPIAATLGVLARFWLRRYLASRLYLDPPAAP
jgi:predicted PurR-regulated permease PerM